MADETRPGMSFQPTILSAFVIGTLAIVFIRLIATGLGGAIFATIVAIGVIAWHGLGRRQESDRSRVADDTYYLGLLFTLVSLVFALVYLFIINPEGDFDERTQALIGNFGIGLLSTVAGILGRILLQSSLSESAPVTTELVEQPRAPPDDLAQETMALRREVREATDAMRHFTRVTLGEAHQTRTHTKLVIGEFSNELRTAAQQALSEAASEWRSFNEELVPIQKALNDTARAFTALTENMRSRAEQSQEFATSAIEELRQEIDGAAKASRAEAISAWQAAAQQIRDHSLKLHLELEKVSAATSQRAESSLSSLASKVIDSTDATVQMLSDQVQAMTELVEHTRHAKQSFDSLTTGIVAVEGTLRSFDGAAASATKEMDARAEEVTKVRDDTAEIADSSLAHSQKAEETANELSNEVSTQVSRLQALLGRLDQVTSRLAEAVPRLSNVDRGN